MTSWDERLLAWTKPASDDEDLKRERTEKEIRAALAAHPGLSCQNTRVYAKGSYANNTNVRLDSDVDIAVENESIYHPDGLDDQVSKAEIGFQPYDGPYPTFDSFKTAVHEALRNAFGSTAVKRENKCITIRERRTTLPADVVPSWQYREYHRWSGRPDYRRGTVFWAERDGNRIINFPQQNYDNGVSKNNRTGTRYKKTVRAVKRLENEMVTKGVIDEVPSYLIECLVYRCPDHVFSGAGYLAIIRDALRLIYNHTDGDTEPEGDRWCEVNDIKYLFHPTQKWKLRDGNQFALAAWRYLGLI